MHFAKTDKKTRNQELSITTFTTKQTVGEMLNLNL